jgi:protein-S-isoprenylcysteine O-methyltransferase Ste14
MPLADEFEAHGQWLFRWRSYLPLGLTVLFFVALRHYQWPCDSLAVHEAWAKSCVALSFVGLAIRGATIGYVPANTSGRNTRRQVAAQLNTTGMYSIVRHPLYFGNFLIGLGVALVLVVWWLPVIYCLLFCVYYERIMFTEEAFLHRKFGSKFDSWAASTPAFLPRITQWRQPDLAFSLRNMLGREYAGLMLLVLSHAAVEFTEHLIIDRRVVYETFWVTLIMCGTATYLVVRILKKRTTILNVPGR